MHRDEWTLRAVVEADVDTLMQWFPTFEDVNIWGGPSFRYPFTRESFFADIDWERMASFGLFDWQDSLAAFGQLYDREERIHLARLVVDPERRGLGLGRRLIEMLMVVGKDHYPYGEYSLFVYRANEPAYRCYRALGFEIADYPPDVPHADVCDFLTRPA
ncbi:MAG: GNAT family N-acetyltransferase [Woeseiaceae bacterium]|nr:GNAT family N-acetyltransferase [Woeseiaceae bacterium]